MAFILARMTIVPAEEKPGENFFAISSTKILLMVQVGDMFLENSVWNSTDLSHKSTSLVLVSFMGNKEMRFPVLWSRTQTPTIDVDTSSPISTSVF